MSDYLCNLVVPGWPKSGTSSLHEYLNLHEKICMSSTKEPHFFTLDKKYEEGVDFHNDLFSHKAGNELYFGECSTTYCICERALERIKADLNSPKIILLLRDPLNRLVSHYKWMYALGHENRRVLKAVKNDGFSFHPDHHYSGNYKSYLQFSQYSKYVPLWQEHFGNENVHVVFTDELKTHPREVVNSIVKFLELEPLPAVESISANKTSDQLGFSPTLRAVRNKIPDSFADLLKKNPLVYRFGKKMSAPRKRTARDIDEEEKNTLQELLHVDIEYYNHLKEKYTDIP